MIHNESKMANKKASIKDLFTNSTLRLVSICIFSSWFIAGLCFFGLNQYQGHLGGDLFYNVALSGNILVFNYKFNVKYYVYKY